jgi:hypothetical protein
LLPWPALRPLVATRLTSRDLDQCDHTAAHADVELCSLTLAAHVR